MKQFALDIGLAPAPSLDRFIPGEHGSAALAHLRLCVEQGAHACERPQIPTYLWGPGGAGKSYLLAAVRAALHEQGQHVVWMDAHHWTIPSDDTPWDAVLMDDVHLFNAAQQQMAFHWFVQAAAPARGAPRWVLAAGDAAPMHLALREDLRTRLGWGLVFQLHMLNETALRAALRKEADARGIFLRDDVMDYMLTRFARDMGSLMSLLERLDAYALQARRAITVPLLKSMLEEQP